METDAGEQVPRSRVHDRERIAELRSRIVNWPPLKSTHQTSFGTRHFENGRVRAATRCLLRRGFTTPWRLRIAPMVFTLQASRAAARGL